MKAALSFTPVTPLPPFLPNLQRLILFYLHSTFHVQDNSKCFNIKSVSEIVQVQ